MKPFQTRLFTLLACFLLLSALHAQETESIEGYLADWAAQLQPVSTGDNDYTQQIEADPNFACKVVYSIQTTDSKGNQTKERYEFNLADIDYKSIRHRTIKKVIILDIKTDKNQQLIKYFKDDVQQNYENAVQMPAFDSDNAQVLQSIIQGAVRECAELSQQWFEPSDLNTMLSNIDQHEQVVTVDDATYKTSFELAPGHPTQMHYLVEQVSGKGSPASEKYIFNLADIDEKSVQLQVSGKMVGLEFKIEKRRHYIEYYKDGEQQNYADALQIVVQEIEQAKALIALFQASIPLCKIKQAEQMTKATDFDAALAKLQSLLSAEQSLAGDCLAMLTKSTDDGKTLNTYRFFFSDFEVSDIQIEVQRKEVWVACNVQKRIRMIEHHQDNERQNYTNELRINATNIENARLIQHQVSQISGLCASQQDSDAEHLHATDQQLFELLVPLVQAPQANSQNQQRLVSLDESKNVCKLQITQVSGSGKKSTEMVYEFILSDINPKSVNLYISGKDIAIDLDVHKREKLIKSFKDGEVAVYTNTIRIWMPDLETARVAQQTFLSSIATCTP